jgi:hypothetical protein
MLALLDSPRSSALYNKLAAGDYSAELGHCAAVLHDYLSDRAEAVGDEYRLAPGHFLGWLAMGQRSFFGVQVCSTHLLLSRDDEEPYPGYFGLWCDSDTNEDAESELLRLRGLLDDAGVEFLDD